jgi:hypothetical protein
VHKTSVADLDPGSVAFLTSPGSGMEKNPDPGSEMNIPDLIFENLKVFWVKNTSIHLCGTGILSTLDPGSGYCTG